MLHAYADGELDNSERAEVEEYLTADPQARAQLDSILRQNRALKMAYEKVLDEPIPASLTRAGRVKKAARFSPYTSMAAGLAMLVLGGLSGWVAGQHGLFDRNDLLQNRALIAHEIFAPDMDYPVETGTASAEDIGIWLSKRIGTSFKVPDLSSRGYNLMGGRLLVAGAAPAGLLVYEDSTKRRLTIYVAENKSNSHSEYVMEEKGKLLVCYWLEPKLVYALVGEVTREDMVPLAKTAHLGFDA